MLGTTELQCLVKPEAEYRAESGNGAIFRGLSWEKHENEGGNCCAEVLA